METTTINVNEVKKDLYKSKVNAKFSHYAEGKLFYTIVLTDGTYIFPISTIESHKYNDKLYYLSENLGGEDGRDYEIIEEEIKQLSSDLGSTPFNIEMKGSDLNRWIAKSIENNEFIKIS